jgi:hypothetical protein
MEQITEFITFDIEVKSRFFDAGFNVLFKIYLTIP